jgi:hypothetical protein
MLRLPVRSLKFKLRSGRLSCCFYSELGTTHHSMMIIPPVQSLFNESSFRHSSLPLMLLLRKPHCSLCASGPSSTPSTASFLIVSSPLIVIIQLLQYYSSNKLECCLSSFVTGGGSPTSKSHKQDHDLCLCPCWEFKSAKPGKVPRRQNPRSAQQTHH